MNYRNYERLDLDLEPGMILIQGGNGQGKSNLLEALYLLAIAKSPRTSTDGVLVRRQVPREETVAQVFAEAQRDGGSVRVQIDFRGVPAEANSEALVKDGPLERPEEHGLQEAPIQVQKHVRVNGVPRRTSELIGELNAVMFNAQDLDITLGSPVVRRRYLDIMISQLDHLYLRALQKYQRVISQRNYLLKAVRNGRSRPGELDFWDDELVETGSYLMGRRAATVRALSQNARAIHWELTGHNEELQIVYRPNVDVGPGSSDEELGHALRKALELQRPKEMAYGFTMCGPHRDDLQMLIENMDAGLYASRGQCRTVVLSMKLAEASYLMDRSGQEPILLLDDVLSELDEARRAQVLAMAERYQQCFITTTNVEPIEGTHLSRMSWFVVRGGQVEPAAAAAEGAGQERSDEVN